MTTVLLQNTPLINNQDVYDFLQQLHLFQIGLTFVKNDDKEIIKHNKMALENGLYIFVDDKHSCLKRLEMIRPQLAKLEFEETRDVVIPAAHNANVFQLMRDQNLMLYFKPYDALEIAKKKAILSYQLSNKLEDAIKANQDYLDKRFNFEENIPEPGQKRPREQKVAQPLTKEKDVIELSDEEEILEPLQETFKQLAQTYPTAQRKHLIEAAKAIYDAPLGTEVIVNAKPGEKTNVTDEFFGMNNMTSRYNPIVLDDD